MYLDERYQQERRNDLHRAAEQHRLAQAHAEPNPVLAQVGRLLVNAGHKLEAQAQPRAKAQRAY